MQPAAGQKPMLSLQEVGEVLGTIEAFDAVRSGVANDRSQFYKDLSAPFYGANRPGSKVSQGLRDQFWLQSMQVGLRGR